MPDAQRSPFPRPHRDRVKKLGWLILPYAALMGSLLTLTVGTSLAKQLFPMVGAEGTTAYRVGFSALILLILWRPWRTSVSSADRKALALFGGALGLMNLAFYKSLETLPLGIALAIEFLGPLAVAALSSRGARQIVWVFLAALGLLMLLPFGPSVVQLDAVGFCYALAAAVFWALYIIFGARLGHLHPGLSVSFGMTVAALAIVPIGAVSAGVSLIGPHAITLGLVVAALSSAIPYSLEMLALQRLPKRTFGVLLSGEPAVGAIAGLLLLREQLTLIQVAAIGCVVVASIGTVATARSSRR